MKPADLNGAPGGRSIAWSCLLDDTPALWTHFLVWCATLVDCAGVSPEAIVVHHAADLRPDIARLVSALKLRTQPVARFDQRSPHANKIYQCSSDFGNADRVVLTDVDLAFVARPPVERIGASVAGKLVDIANPPIEILCDLFDRAGLPAPKERLAPRAYDASGVLGTFQTLPANYNGGFYVIDRAILAELGAAWAHWLHWLLDAELIPARYAVHVDQIAFCMAVHQLGIDTETLDANWNLPTHVRTPAEEAPPLVVHHHGRLDAALGLLPLQPPRHEASIAATNAAISAFLRRHDIVPMELA